MTYEEYDAVKKEERLVEIKMDMRAFNGLDKSGTAVMVLAIIAGLALWAVAAIRFFDPWIVRGVTASTFSLILGGFAVIILGEALSCLLSALAQHMRDAKVTRKCMEKLIARLERPKAQ